MQSFHYLQTLAIGCFTLLFAITLHEAAHGWVASQLGDKTALFLGRVTLNPLKHIDWLGTIIIPLIFLWAGGFVFGWAKPVPIDFRQLRYPARDMALVALAGPVSNLLMAVFWALIAKLGIGLFQSSPGLVWMIDMGFAGLSINLILFLFNLIPIPPLDGSRLVSNFLPRSIAFYYASIERYGFLILIILMYTKWISVILQAPFEWMRNFIVRLVGI